MNKLIFKLRSCAIFILLSLSFSGHHCMKSEVVDLCPENNQPEESEAQQIVQKIMQQNVATLEWNDEDWPNEPFYDFLERSWRYQKNMAPAKKRRLVFTLFKKQEK